jgi:hypothetical protein
MYPEGGGKVWWVTDEEDIDSTQSLDDDYGIYKGSHIDRHLRASSPNSHPPVQVTIHLYQKHTGPIAPSDLQCVAATAVLSMVWVSILQIQICL